MLTIREKEILQALLTGQKNWVTAQHLGISTRSVYRHTEKIRRKARAVSTVQAVAILVRMGVIL